MRVISLVPSLTELLIDLGVNVVGRTRFCIHPKGKIEDIDIVGGTKNPNIEKIEKLKPDLVVGNSEENRKEDVESITRFSRVEVTEVADISDALETIFHLGALTGTHLKASEMVKEIEVTINGYQKRTKLSAAYLIWKKPWMTIGNDTYIHQVMQFFDLVNVYGNQSRYPEISMESLKAKQPDVILLSSEPYPFSQKHVDELSENFSSNQIYLVNGEWFSWYGSRMKPAFEALAKWRKSIG